MGNPVVYFEVGCRDRDASDAFYAALFDWDLERREHSSVIDTGGGGINGHIASLGHEPHTYTMFYVEVDDLDASLRRTEALGGRTIVGPTTAPDVTFAWIADPEGNVIGLIEATTDG